MRSGREDKRGHMACSISQMSQRLLGILPTFFKKNFRILLKLFFSLKKIVRVLVTWIFLATYLLLQSAGHSVGQRGLSGQVKVFHLHLNIVQEKVSAINHQANFQKKKYWGKQSLAAQF